MKQPMCAGWAALAAGVMAWLLPLASSARAQSGTSAEAMAASQPTVNPASAAVRISPNWDAPTIAVPADFAGLSYETSYLLPDKNKQYYFNGQRQTLIGMFRTLGVHNLRIGGNTADRPGVPVPHGTDIDNLFAFAKGANVKVLYTLRLRQQQNQNDDAAIAKYILSRYDPLVDYLAVGNEPDIYFKQYPAYRDALEKFIDAVRAESPDARFSGPATTPGKAAWARNLANDLGTTGKISLITQHNYAGGNARSVKDPAAARLAMLSPNWLKQYQKIYDAFVPTVFKDHLQYRIEETNSYYNGGAEHVSDTFAAALWGLDYLYWWAEHRAAGLNFHTGDFVAAGEQQTICRYAVFTRSGEEYVVHPLGYAMAAFELGCHGGQLVPLKVEAGDLNVRAYGVHTVDENFYVTLINKDVHTTATVAIDVGHYYARADYMAMAAPNNDIAATDHITLGGAGIRNDSNWTGSWTALQPPAHPGEFAFPLPPASAMVVRFESP